jgi:hypothetical protein
MQPGVMHHLQDAVGDWSVQLYQRVPRSKALPPALSKLRR